MLAQPQILTARRRKESRKHPAQQDFTSCFQEPHLLQPELWSGCLDFMHLHVGASVAVFAPGVIL